MSENQKKQIEKKLLTVSELGLYLGSTEYGIRNLIRKGRIPFVRIGRSIRFDLDKINLWIEKNSVSVI